MPNFSCVAQRGRHCVNAMLTLARRTSRGLLVEYIVSIDVAQARSPAVAFFTLLGQPFLQILLREIRRVKGMWCCDIKANTTHGTMRCRSLLLPQYNRPRSPMDKASAYGAGDGRFESCRGHLCVNMQQHGLTSIIRHAELENE